MGSNLPCATGSIAAASADTQHSGSKEASTRTITVATTGMSTAKTFAVCYTEAVGDDSATWTDSGIRVVLSKVTSISYGAPARTMTSANMMSATNSIPQITNVQLTYSGDLANNKFISLVDSTLNSGDPCNADDATFVAAASADATHSGKVQAGGNDKAVTIPQSTLLDAAKIYAVCYAEINGLTTDTTWADSYIRLKISKVYSVSSHAVTTYTSGQLARTAALLVTYAGSLAANRWVSLVDQTLGPNFP